MSANAADSPATGDHRDHAQLTVIPPSIPRDDVESTGRVGTIAYPYRVYEARVTVERPLIHDSEFTYVATVDRSRRLVVRADTFPETETREVSDVLVIPSELTDDETKTKARESVFKWTLRKFSLGSPPEIEFERTADAYKLFWLAERPGGDVVIDSVRGTEEPLNG